MELKTERRRGSYTSGTGDDYVHDALRAHALTQAIMESAVYSGKGAILYPAWYFERADELMAQWAKEGE